jgi:hypothetical protein
MRVAHGFPQRSGSQGRFSSNLFGPSVIHSFTECPVYPVARVAGRLSTDHRLLIFRIQMPPGFTGFGVEDVVPKQI